MDPNANLAEQERLYVVNGGKSLHFWPKDDRIRLRALRDALADWCFRGGFEPDWSIAPVARRYYGR